MKIPFIYYTDTGNIKVLTFGKRRSPYNAGIFYLRSQYWDIGWMPRIKAGKEIPSAFFLRRGIKLLIKDIYIFWLNIRIFFYKTRNRIMGYSTKEETNEK